MAELLPPSIAGTVNDIYSTKSLLYRSRSKDIPLLLVGVRACGSNNHEILRRPPPPPFLPRHRRGILRRPRPSTIRGTRSRRHPPRGSVRRRRRTNGCRRRRRRGSAGIGGREGLARRSDEQFRQGFRSHLAVSVRFHSYLLDLGFVKCCICIHMILDSLRVFVVACSVNDENILISLGEAHGMFSEPRERIALRHKRPLVAIIHNVRWWHRSLTHTHNILLEQFS